MRCPYCYNAPIVFDKGQISLQEVLDFLKTRQNRLSGVVLSGGECTNYPYLKEFAKEIKSLNFKIKIDTNGLNPSLIKELMEENLVDYIALDYKAPKEKFENITKNRHFEKFSQTLNTLISSNLTFEVRTTIHSKLLGIDDINSIIKDLSKRGYKGTYYLQNYLHTDSTIEDIGKQKRDYRYLKTQRFDRYKFERVLKYYYKNFRVKKLSIALAFKRFTIVVSLQ